MHGSTPDECAVESISEILAPKHQEYVIWLRHLTFSVLGVTAVFEMARRIHREVSKQARRPKRGLNPETHQSQREGGTGNGHHSFPDFRSASVKQILSRACTRLAQDMSVGERRVVLDLGECNPETGEFEPGVDASFAEEALGKLYKCGNCLFISELHPMIEIVHSAEGDGRDREQTAPNIVTQCSYPPSCDGVETRHIRVHRMWEQVVRPVGNTACNDNHSRDSSSKAAPARPTCADETVHTSHFRGRPVPAPSAPAPSPLHKQSRCAGRHSFGCGSSTSTEYSPHKQTISHSGRPSRRRAAIEQSMWDISISDLYRHTLAKRCCDVRTSLCHDETVPSSEVPCVIAPTQVRYMFKQYFFFKEHDLTWKYTVTYCWEGVNDEDAEYAFWTSPYRILLEIEPVDVSAYLQGRSKVHHSVFVSTSALRKACDLFGAQPGEYSMRSVIQPRMHAHVPASGPHCGEFRPRDHLSVLQVACTLRKDCPEGGKLRHYPVVQARGDGHGMFLVMWACRKRRLRRRRERDRARNKRERNETHQEGAGVKRDFEKDRYQKEALQCEQHVVSESWRVARTDSTEDNESEWMQFGRRMHGSDPRRPEETKRPLPQWMKCDENGPELRETTSTSHRVLRRSARLAVKQQK